MVGRANRRYHDRVAGRYDEVYDGPYWRFYRDVSWRHLKRFLPAARPARAADLGCGTGWFGRRLLEAGFDVDFVDPSGKMLARAADAVADAHGGVPRFVQGELEDLAALADGSLAFATAQGDPLSFCADPLRALRELRRVVAPQGCVVLSVDNRVAGVRKLAEAAAPDAVLELLRTGRTEWTGDRDGERFGMKMFDPDELDRLLVKTGFEPLSKIAKTCLVQRHNEAWLDDPRARLRLLDAEERIHALPQYLGLAGHFQVAARRT